MADFTNNSTEKVAPATLTPEFKDFYNLRFTGSKPNYTIQGQFSKDEMEKIIKDVYDNVESFGIDYDRIDKYLEQTSITSDSDLQFHLIAILDCIADVGNPKLKATLLKYEAELRAIKAYNKPKKN